MVMEGIDNILDGNTDLIVYSQSMHAVRSRDVTTLRVREKGVPKHFAINIGSKLYCH